MKNNKLPLKERYNNFIQKHPKFWLTLIYGVLMFALAIAMLVAVLSPPDTQSATASSRAGGSCPSQYYNDHIAISTSNTGISTEQAYSVSVFVDDAEFRVISCAASFEYIGSEGPTLLSYRYITFYRMDVSLPDGSITHVSDIFFSNSQNDPRTDPYPSDRLTLVKSSENSAPFYIEDVHYVILNTTYLPDGFFEIIFPAMDLELFSNLVGENGCWTPPPDSCSPDDLKAEYDKGHSDGFASGKNEGLIEGEDIGYNKGFVAGQNSVDPFPNPVSYLIEPIISFLNIKFFDTLTLGGVLSVGIFVMVAVMFIKLFAGG